MVKDTSIARAWDILNYHLSTLKPVSVYLHSVILVGSLATGSYTSDSGSDIDLIHILNDDAPSEARAQVLRRIEQTEEDTNHDIPISRCVYRRMELFPPYPTNFELSKENKDLLELPIELLRLKDCGKTIWGNDVTADIPFPTREAVIESKKLEAQWAKKLEKAGTFPSAEELPTRLIVQSVLVRALLDYFFETGNTCSNKAAIAAKMQEAVPSYAFLELAHLCTNWRYHPQDVTEADDRRIHELWDQWLIRRRRKPVHHVEKDT